MCTVNVEDGEIDLMKGREVTAIIGTPCRKCIENKSEVVLREKDPYCRVCFLAYVTHKFRASLGKSRMVHRGDKILIGFSGGSSSLALLHLVKLGIEEISHKRLVFEPLVVYIDEGAVFDISVEERECVVKNITSILAHYNFPSYLSSLEFLFQRNQNKYFYELGSKSSITSDSKLVHLFSKVKCQTSKEDLIVKLRNKLLLKIAAELGCCKILTAESLVSTAVKLLSNISLGRGGQLPFEIGFCDSRDKSIKILRPMQDFGKEEIDFYCKACNLESVDSFTQKSNDNKSAVSLQMLTRQFVNDLQENFPSTISTVYRIGAKLNMEDGTQAADTCSLCMAPLDTSVVESSSLQATMYSSRISKNGPMHNTLNDEKSILEMKNTERSGMSCKNDEASCHCNKSVKDAIVSKNDAMGCLCYGCRLIVNDLESLDDLPQDVVNSITENSAFRQMRNEIQDFLL